MNIIFMLIPISLVLVGLMVWVFMWFIRSGQFDDMEGPAYRILMDDDSIHPHQKTDKDAGSEQLARDRSNETAKDAKDCE